MTEPGAAGPGSPACVWLTSLRADGSPHTAPVWFVLDRDPDVVWVGTSAGTAKVRNLDGDPRVSLALDGTGADPWVAQGTATVHDPFDRGRFAAVLAAFADKYDGWDAADASRYGPRVLLEIAVDRWLLSPGN